MRATVALAGLGVAATLAFVFGVLAPRDGTETTFAAIVCMLVIAALCGPALYERRAEEGAFAPTRRGAKRAALLGGVTALTAAGTAAVSGGPLPAALACGAFCGLYAFASGAAGDFLGVVLGARAGRVLAATAAVALLSTLLVWDAAFLDSATDPKLSAYRAFALNPAAAASITLGYDWVPQGDHLYRQPWFTPFGHGHNQTAESMAGVPRAGLGVYAVKTGGAALLFGVAAGAFYAWRRRAAA